MKVTNRQVEATAGGIVSVALGLFAHREGIRDAAIASFFGAIEGQTRKIQLRVESFPIEGDVLAALNSARCRLNSTLSTTPALDIFVPVGSDPAARSDLARRLSDVPVTVTAGSAQYLNGGVALELIFQPANGQVSNPLPALRHPRKARRATSRSAP